MISSQYLSQIAPSLPGNENKTLSHLWQAKTSGAPLDEQSRSKGEDAWLDVSNQVLFRPFAPELVDEAFKHLSSITAPGRRSTAIDEVVTGLDGPEAGASFSQEELTPASGTQAAQHFAPWQRSSGSLKALGDSSFHDTSSIQTASQGQLEDMMRLANKLLKRPAIQAEFIRAMMDDPDIRDVLWQECIALEPGLLAAGLPSRRQLRQLLPPAQAQQPAVAGMPPEVSELEELAGEQGSRSGQSSPLKKLVEAVAHSLEASGSALGSLGHWLRSRLQALLGSSSSSSGSSSMAHGMAHMVCYPEGGEEEGAAALGYGDCIMSAGEAQSMMALHMGQMRGTATAGGTGSTGNAHHAGEVHKHSRKQKKQKGANGGNKRVFGVAAEMGDEEVAGSTAGGTGGSTSGPAPRSSTDVVLGGAMLLAASGFCLLLLQQPADKFLKAGPAAVAGLQARMAQAAQAAAKVADRARRAAAGRGSGSGQSGGGSGGSSDLEEGESSGYSSDI